MVAETDLLIRINGSAKQALDEFDKLNKKSKETQQILAKVAKLSAVAFTGLVAVIGGLTKAYADYETALVGVGKTTDISGKKLKSFGKEFQQLSKEIPISTNELLGIAQAAGQLGVTGEKNLLKFTDTIAKLGVATDLTGEEAATALTRILTVTGEGIETIDTFGSVIVALGNNFAATESEIVRMTNELSRSTTIFGVSAAEAAALGTAMRSVGIQAQLGGSVVGKAFLKIGKAVDKGGKQFKLLEKLTGLTGDTLKQTFKEDATKVFQSFVEGLGSLEGGAIEITNALEQFGLRGDEVNKVLPVLAENSALVGRALETAAKETRNATALNKEAAAAFATINSNIQRTKNTMLVAAVVMGEKLAPAVNSLLDVVQDVANAISETDDETLEFIATLLKWATVAAGIAAGMATFILGVIKLSALIGTLSAVFLPATVAASGFWLAVTGPVGLAVAGIAALGAGLVALSTNIQKNKQLPKTLEEFNTQLDRLKKKRDILNKTSVRLGGGPAEVKKVDEEIAKLEELRRAKIKASKDFGTGALLVRPEAEKGVDLGASAFGLEEEQELPFKTKAQVTEDTRLDTLKKKNIKLADEAKASSERLASIVRQENKVIAAENRRASEEELAIIKQRDVVKKAQVEAANEDDKIVKAALEERTVLHQNKLAELEKNYNDRKVERDRIDKGQKAELDLAAKEAGINLNTEFNELEREQLEEKIITEDELKAEVANRRLNEEIERRNQFIKDKTQFGETVAKINNFLNRSEIQGAEKAASQLVALQNSKNSELKAIGKAAALVRISIDTAQGAIGAYQSLASIPIVGPALGIVAAGALTAFGIEKAAEVTGAQSGGLVGSGVKGIDSQLFSLGRGELIAPDKSFDEVVEGTARGRGFVNPEEEGTASGGGTIRVEIEPKGDLINFIEQQIIETQIQNTGVA